MDINQNFNSSGVIGDFNITGTFLTRDVTNGISSSTSYAILSNGKLELTFLNGKQCTKLIIDPYHRTDLGDKYEHLYNCVFLSYDHDDTQRFKDEIPLTAYQKDIVLDIDPNLILHDPIFFTFFMKIVISLKRVEKYIANGCEKNPEIPSGNYLGGAVYDNKGRLQKRFDPYIGSLIHSQYREKIVTDSLNDHVNGIISENARIDEEIASLQKRINELVFKKQANLAKLSSLENDNSRKL